MLSTGYFELDRLTATCAINYIFDETRKEYSTNIFSVDANGTGAGGAFTTVDDIRLFWENLISCKLLSFDMTSNMIKNHVGEADCYGYGMWLRKNNKDYIPYFQGFNPGVSFFSCYDTISKILIVLVSNYGDNVWKICDNIIKHFNT